MLKQPAVIYFLVSFLLNSVTTLNAQTITEEQKNISPASWAVVAVPIKKNYDEDARAWYAVYNLGSVLHVYLAVVDPIEQRKILNSGMELWIDTKGKKNKTTGIAFPINTAKTNERPAQGPPPGFNGPGGPGVFDNQRRPDTNNIKDLEKTIALQREMKLTGFKPELNGLQNIVHPSGIQVSLYFIKDTLVYDAQLPLNTLTDAPLVNSRISIGFIAKGMAMPDFGGGQMPPPPDGGGGGGGGGGGDGMPPPGGPPPGGGEDRMRLFQDDIIWYKFSLQN